MKNLFIVALLLFTGLISYAENNLHQKNENDDFFRSCYVTVITESENMFGQTIEESSTYYLGEVDNNGFGNLDCISRARRFVTLYEDLL